MDDHPWMMHRGVFFYKHLEVLHKHRVIQQPLHNILGRKKRLIGSLYIYFSARLGSARLGSARFGSARLGSARLGSARLGSARLGSARLGSARLGLARLGSARWGGEFFQKLEFCPDLNTILEFVMLCIFSKKILKTTKYHRTLQDFANLENAFEHPKFIFGNRTNELRKLHIVFGH